jgi:hypothetical protein
MKKMLLAAGIVASVALAACSTTQLQNATNTLAAGCKIGAPTGNAIAAGTGNAVAGAAATANTVFCGAVENAAASAASAPVAASAAQ